ncbi:hypothetical protein CKM354_000296200 [Cercospora kikuchii]|uniref:SIS domain-containing protein n=1 Tax=Cercospora kikuchii TaxID=84275 RepID=A0A9P3CJB3_9PEZI|nr:uncharacterized protein CKM354_000296200 [Cercospora kikuchii]GIZ39583.1 hypothetical protein CKM354_000296200 [Cercospora kikuchii]
MDLSRPCKRRRLSTPLTPPSPVREEDLSSTEDRSFVLERAVNVLRVEAEALARVAALYSTDKVAQHGLSAAQRAIIQSQSSQGKLVVCGVGKSGFIAQKLVATCKSLGIRASFLHACEAVHGDIGDVRDNDVLLFVSFSGKTVELLNVLPHISPEVQVMAMSAQRHPRDCQLLEGIENGILLPAPIHQSEEASFGVKAPTTSTTVALAISDMLALTVAEALHQGNTSEVFLKNHPGGAIGMSRPEINVVVAELPSPSISDESED